MTSPRPWHLSEDGDFVIDVNGDPVCDLRYWHLPHLNENVALMLKTVNEAEGFKVVQLHQRDFSRETDALMRAADEQTEPLNKRG